MDPWADDGGDAGPSAWPPTSSNVIHSTSPPRANLGAQASVDPWADEEQRDEGELVIGETTHSPIETSTRQDPPVEGVSNDFDPWGGGAPPATTSERLTSDLANASRSQSTEQDRGAENDEDGWQPDNLHLDPPQRYEESEVNPMSTAEEEPSVLEYDEDDPWGSGAKARQLKAQRDAEAAAQQMEILAIKNDSQGQAMKQSEVKSETKVDKLDTVAVGEAAESNVKEDEAKTSQPQGSSGWRSLFSRGSAKTENLSGAAMDRKSSEAGRSDAGEASKPSPSIANSSIAPRLWQAPTLRTGHARSPSSASQGSSSKDANVAPTKPTVAGGANDTQGPGWTMNAKKQPASTGGGFLSSLLSTARDGSSNRPAVATADDADESGEFEGSGVEWEAGAQFESGARKPTTKDLLSNDEPMQESGVSRLLGRWRNRQAGNQSTTQQDDLAWLENLGGSGAPTQDTTHPKPDEEDWLAFMEGQNPAITKPTPTPPAIPKAGGRIVIPNVVKKSSIASPHSPGQLLPPPRAGTPSQRNSALGHGIHYDVDDLAEPSQVDRSLAGTAYRDEPDSYDDALLRQDKLKPISSQSRNAKPSLFSSLSGRTVRPYTFEDDDEVEGARDDSWSAFRDGDRYQDESSTRNTSSAKVTKLAPPTQIADQKPQQTRSIAPLPPPSSTTIVRPMVKPAEVDLMQSVASPVAANTTSAPARKPLSQGKTLTNDDLSFFENL